jgi:adenylate kinase family enzyme
MGQSCTGKSTLADQMKTKFGAEVYSGKDYMRMAKNENEAWKIFYKLLENASIDKSPENVLIYVITEKEHLNKLSSLEGVKTVKFTASLEIIKERFTQRMRGNLPIPVEKKLEIQYKEWEMEKGDLVIDTSQNIDVDEQIESLIKHFIM